MKREGFLQSIWNDWCSLFSLRKTGGLSLIMAFPFLVSCSVLQASYSQLDWVVLWRVDRYFDLTESQKEWLAKELAKIHVWHRQEELPAYAQFLTQVRQFVEGGLTAEKIDRIFGAVEIFRVHLAREFSSPGARLFSTLSPEQVQHFQTVLSQDNQEVADEIGNDPEERLEKRTAATLKRVSSWVGDLSKEQQHHIEEWMVIFPDISQEWLAHRKHKQKVLIDLIHSSSDPDTLQPGLEYWLERSQNGATEEYQMALERWRKGVKALLLQIDEILTFEQRMHLSHELQEIIDDLQGMV